MIKKEQYEVLMQSIKMGMSNIDAINIARVSKDWFYRKIKNDPKFSAEIEAIRSEWKQSNLAIIQKAALHTWQAAAWILERKASDEFALRQKVEHSGELKTESIVEQKVNKMDQLSMEALSKKLDAILRGGKS